MDGRLWFFCENGKSGASLLLATREWIEKMAFENIVINDRNGFGGSFFAWFFIGHLREEMPIKCMQFGSIYGE